MPHFLALAGPGQAAELSSPRRTEAVVTPATGQELGGPAEDDPMLVLREGPETGQGEGERVGYATRPGAGVSLRNGKITFF